MASSGVVDKELGVTVARICKLLAYTRPSPEDVKHDATSDSGTNQHLQGHPKAPQIPQAPAQQNFRVKGTIQDDQAKVRLRSRLQQYRPRLALILSLKGSPGPISPLARILPLLHPLPPPLVDI